MAKPAVPAGADAASHDQHDDDDDHSADQQRNRSAADAGAHGPAVPLRSRTRFGVQAGAGILCSDGSSWSHSD